MHRFQKNYTSLFLKLEGPKALKNPREVIKIMYRFTGGNLNPRSVFCMDSGMMKPIKVLRSLANQMFRRIIKPGESRDHMVFYFNDIQDSPRPETTPLQDHPTNAESRLRLLRSHISEPSVYFDQSGNVRGTG